jgi:hypothetical protein
LQLSNLTAERNRGCGAERRSPDEGIGGAPLFTAFEERSTSTTSLITRELAEKSFFERFLEEKSRAEPRFLSLFDPILSLFDPKVIISGAIFY